MRRKQEKGLERASNGNLGTAQIIMRKIVFETWQTMLVLVQSKVLKSSDKCFLNTLSWNARSLIFHNKKNKQNIYAKRIVCLYTATYNRQYIEDGDTIGYHSIMPIFISRNHLHIWEQ